mmetsp:Transcript_49311/g.148462  ORF Transcript_49311/g.148462 Transcript_49311/m.148462 type:complete len:275 (+) Transcript_49311:18-842(+)
MGRAAPLVVLHLDVHQRLPHLNHIPLVAAQFRYRPLVPAPHGNGSLVGLYLGDGIEGTHVIPRRDVPLEQFDLDDSFADVGHEEGHHRLLSGATAGGGAGCGTGRGSRSERRLLLLRGRSRGRSRCRRWRLDCACSGIDTARIGIGIGIDGSPVPARLHGDMHQRTSRLDHVAPPAAQIHHRTLVPARQRHGRLIGLHVGDDVVLPHVLSGRHVPLQQFHLGDAFPDVGEKERYRYGLGGYAHGGGCNSDWRLFRRRRGDGRFEADRRRPPPRP